ANLGSIHASLTFEARIYHESLPDALKGTGTLASRPWPAGNPAFVIQGRWEYDGSREHYLIHNPTEKGALRSCEVIVDEYMCAYIILGLQTKANAIRINNNVHRFPV